MSASVERALRVLVELSGGPLTISDLGRRLDVHRTTSLRLLRTLEDQRFVRRGDDGRYRLGPLMTTLAHAALDGLDLRSMAHRHLRALGDRHGYTVHLAGIEDDEVVYLDKIESRHTIRMYSRIGATAPLHATGVGKAILAHLDDDAQERVLAREPYQRCTPRTHTTRAGLEAELATSVRRGWALDDFEHEELIHCVAAPVFDAAERVTAAVSISVPQMMLDRDGLVDLAPDVISTADAISEELGWNRR